MKSSKLRMSNGKNKKEYFQRKYKFKRPCLAAFVAQSCSIPAPTATAIISRLLLAQVDKVPTRKGSSETAQIHCGIPREDGGLRHIVAAEVCSWQTGKVGENSCVHE